MSTRRWLLGSDEYQFDYLEWMIQQLQDKSEYPIVVADFALTQSQKAKLLDRKIGVIRCKKPYDGIAWFMKPIAIDAACSFYDQVCWLDNDIEIVGNPDEIWDHVKPGVLKLVEDWWMQKRTTIVMYNSGVVLAQKPSRELMDKWTEVCSMGQKRGDQEALALVLTKDYFNRWHEKLPNRFNWQRLQEEALDRPDDVVFIHWTGPVGKEIVRTKMRHYR